MNGLSYCIALDMIIIGFIMHETTLDRRQHCHHFQTLVMDVVNMREWHVVSTVTFLPFVVLIMVVVVIVIIAPYVSNDARYHKCICCDGKQVDKGMALASMDICGMVLWTQQQCGHTHPN
jgi:hypothetical protein